MSHPIKWAAQLPHVREVSLFGSADLTYWTNRLPRDELSPLECDGRAQILVTTADSKFMGVRFREMSFSIKCRRVGDQPGGDAAFLVRAFNSCRFFAFCERRLFSTPYDHGSVSVEASLPASIQLALKGEISFQATMAAGERKPAREGDESWDGSIFLSQPKPGQRRFFYARLRGHTLAFPFLPSKDVLEIQPTPQAPILQELIDSDFRVHEWLIRADAAHAKSKTYKTDEL